MGIEQVFQSFFSQVVEYLPSLAAGLLLVALGVIAAWFAKRLTIQICIMLRLHRLLAAFRWARGLTRTDVRLSLFSVLGSVTGFVVFLVFLNAAFAAMRLTVVSDLVQGLVLVFPRLVLAGVIFGFGWLISLGTSQAVRRALLREHVPRASLAAGYARLMLLLLFAAMALFELNVSRQIVLIGFAVVYITLGALTIIVTAFGGRSILRSIPEESPADES